MGKSGKKDRIFLIDEVRGFAIIMMVLYHAAYDLVVIYHVDFPLFYHPVLRILEQLFAGLFIIISGMSSRLSKSNLKRGFICLGIALVITFATWYFLPSELILFGIIHLLGVSMILFALLKPLLDRIPAGIGFGVFFVLGLLTLGVPYGYIGIKGLLYWSLPAAWYTTSWLFPLGFVGTGFYSADYFSLLPWLFIFLAGTFAGIPLRDKKFPGEFYRSHSKFLQLAGRNTLIIYILHQPILYGLFSMIFALSSR